MAIQLASFPEELLERILAAAVVAPPHPNPRASWHPPPTDDTHHPRTRLAPLLASRTLYRIALPLFYHTLVLHGPSQARACHAALAATPHLARSVRTLVLVAPTAEDAALLQLLQGCACVCGARCQGACGLHALDITLPSAGDAREIASAVGKLTGLQTLTVRKAAGTYLSQPAPRAVLAALADAVSGSSCLVETTTSFPLSADPALAPLIAALAAAPHLQVLRTPVPALWAPALLSISANPALARISLDSPAAFPAYSPPSPARKRVLSGSGGGGSGRPLLGTSLFLSEARKHGRLAELIRAGSAVVGFGWRGRAWTVGGAGYAAGAGAGAAAEAPRAGRC
ncbi:hypothetical protein DFH07DRAFT_954299 [Mycena maculata]|uniref:Uncharacterized protein n=1 Tax=Mycena maculata TaxID=230809 RepID=A0AAD7JQF0_9AGAR|nr:hypothetical protein DFH07DRAFT_954299 [Mycena maculata]